MATALGDYGRHQRINFLLLGAFLTVVLLFGGASRADVMTLPVVRLAAIFLIAAALAQITRDQWRLVRLPAGFLILIALVIALQMVPLPYDLWASLPGRGRFDEMLSFAGIPEVWRPISMTPDLTANSLLAVLPPLALVLGVAVAGPQALRLLAPMMLIAIVCETLIGLVQVAGGGPYFYRITNYDAAVGLFANRNHLAVFVALALPLAAAWTTLPHPDPHYRRLRFWLALCAAAGAIPFLLIIGSRAGLLVAALGAVAALPLIRSRRPGRSGGDRQERWTWLIAVVPLVVAAAAALAARVSGRDLALRRLFEADSGLRTDHLPVYFQMVRDFFPFGSGFGSFDPMFRSYEPQTSLNPSYLNHAHNDLVQIVIEGGLPALVLAAVFGIWFVVASARIWTGKVQSSIDLYARAGTIVVLQLLVASSVDYPLRTPFLGIVFAIACCWMLRLEGATKMQTSHDGKIGT